MDVAEKRKRPWHAQVRGRLPIIDKGLEYSGSDQLPTYVVCCMLEHEMNVLSSTR